VPCSGFLASKIPDAKLVIYEKSGHITALEEKTPFQKDVRQFVRALGIDGLEA